MFLRKIYLLLFSVCITFSMPANAVTWGETITAGNTAIKASHINELRSEIENLASGGSSDWMHSGSNFVDGTLVVTDIPANVTNGPSFVIEISGKSYSGTNAPFKAVAQGYLYGGNIINYSGVSYGGDMGATMKIFENNGVLNFWWPRVSYWNSFNVHVRDANGAPDNRVTSIINSAEPTGSKKVTVTWQKSIQTNNAGNVGIGTSAPAYKLDINSANGAVRIGPNTSYSRNFLLGGWGTGTAEAWVRTSNGNLHLDSRNTNNTYINHYSNGDTYVGWGNGAGTGDLFVYNNVGIGTTTPSQKLHVAGNARINNGGNYSFLQLGSGTYDQLYADNTAAKSYGGGLWFRIQNASGSYTDNLRLAENGNVGIGVNPVDKLHVVGNVRLTGNLRRTAHNSGHLEGSYNTVGANGAQSNPIYTIGGNYNPSTTTLGNMYGVGYAYGNQASFILGTASNWGMYVAADGDARTFLNGGTGNSYINSGGGNVGIGTASPTAKLHISGNDIKFTDDAPTIRLNDTNNDDFLIHNNSDRLYFMRDDNDNNTWDDGEDDRITMYGAGSAVRLGIGASTPTHTLDVRGPMRSDHTSATYDLWIQGGAATSGDDRNLALLGIDEDSGDYLAVNHAGEYAGGTRIHGGNLAIGNVAPTSGVHIAKNTDVNSVNDMSAGLLIGASGAFLAVDGNEMQAHNGTSAINYNMQPYGGSVGISDWPDGGLKFDVNGNIGANNYCDGAGNNCVKPGQKGVVASLSGGSFGQTPSSAANYFKNGNFKVFHWSESDSFQDTYDPLNVLRTNKTRLYVPAGVSKVKFRIMSEIYPNSGNSNGCQTSYDCSFHLMVHKNGYHHSSGVSPTGSFADGVVMSDEARNGASNVTTSIMETVVVDATAGDYFTATGRFYYNGSSSTYLSDTFIEMIVVE